MSRQMFSTSRAADFLDASALVSQTGLPVRRFGDVVVKELLDNALDACETAGVAPEVDVSTVAVDGKPQVTVSDNGGGIAADTVTRILDYSTLTSDKALYRSPCRGAQGNAWKTLLGIPYALGVTDPVVVEAHGVRHEVTVGLDPAGNLQVRHDQTPSQRTVGTAVTVPLPCSGALTPDVSGWVASYALVNPHATFTASERAHSEDPGVVETYKPTVGGGWRKPVPTDPTSPWWYTDAAFTRLAYSLAALGDDRPLGAFVAEFKGLSSTAKRKAIAAAVPAVRRVVDLVDSPDAAGALLAAMREASAEPKVAVLGQVPAGHYEELLDRLYGVDRFWHAHGGIVHDGVPWHVEAAVAVTRDRGGVFYGCNYATSFGDPLGSTMLRTADVSTCGTSSFLASCDATPGYGNGHRRAAVVHVTCAAPVFTDKGKTHLDVPGEVADLAARVLWKVSRELHREKRSADRAEDADARAAERQRKAADRPAMSKKQAVFAVIADAIDDCRGDDNLPFSSHDLFYAIRPRALKLLPASTKLKSPYVEQTVIPAWEREHGRIQGMYREPRGVLHHPHDPDGDRDVQLGTREVEVYVPPAWTYNKMLVVEKAGRGPVIQAARLGDRYDIAVILNEGFGTVSCRELLAKMPPGDVTIYVLHDADWSGYNIARTLGEETARMPDHRVDVVDLGLTVEHAIARGLESEEQIREKALPRRLQLTDVAREWFTGTEIAWNHYGKPTKWSTRRVELNALKSQFIAFIEEQLDAHDAPGKVIPPAAVITDEARRRHRVQVSAEVQNILDELLDVDALTDTLVDETAAAMDFDIGDAHVGERFDRHRELSWRTVVADEVAARVQRTGIDLRARLVALLAEQGGT